MTDMTSSYTDARGLLYRDGMLDPDSAKRVTSAALKNCDDGELYLQYRVSESFGFDDGRLKTADYSTDAGFGLRGVSGEMTGFAHANEISEAAIAAQHNLGAARSGKAIPRPAASAQQPAPLYRGQSAGAGPVRRKGCALRQDRRRGAGERPACLPSIRQPRRKLVCCRHRPCRWLQCERYPPAGAPQRLGHHGGRRMAGARPAYMAAVGAISMTA
jgi:hypothetical protein